MTARVEVHAWPGYTVGMRRAAPLALMLQLAWQPACASPRASAASAPVATAASFSVSDAELAAYIQAHPKIAVKLYDLRHAALEDLTYDKLLEAAAKKGGLSTDAYLKTQVDKQTVAPSDAEVRAFYDSRIAAQATAERPFTYEDVAPRIREHLLEQRRQEALKLVLERLRTEAKLRLLLPSARIALPSEGPVRGPASAKVTIVEWSDYQCPYCQKQEDALKQILATYPTQVRLIARDFPLPMHPYAGPAAKAATCADAQGHFWEMHDRMFQNPSELDEDSLKKAARALGLDGPRFDACVAAPETAAKVAQSEREGEAAGVEGTPALFLNGRPVYSAVGFDELKSMVQEELGSELGSEPGNERPSNGKPQ